MELFEHLSLGFGVAFTPINLLYCLVGCILGTLIGVLPGIGPVATIAMLLPVTFARVHRDRIAVKSVMGHQLSSAPAPRQPDKVTMLEEEKICAYYGAGTLYATPRRQEPML